MGVFFMSLRKTVKNSFLLGLSLINNFKTLVMKFPKFIIKKSSNEQYYFTLWSAIEEIVLTSEMYTAKQNCKNGIESVKTNAPYDKNYERKISDNLKYYFVLKSAQNGQVIGVSKMYTSVSDRDNCIEIVKRDAPIAETEDLS